MATRSRSELDSAIPFPSGGWETGSPRIVDTQLVQFQHLLLGVSFNDGHLQRGLNAVLKADWNAGFGLLGLWNGGHAHRRSWGNCHLVSARCTLKAERSIRLTDCQ